MIKHRKAADEDGNHRTPGARNVDSGFQIQLQDDGGGSTRQRWMETGRL